MFTDKIEPIIYNGVATLFRTDLIPKEIGSVGWSWNYDEGQLNTNKFNNVLYFPWIPVNILSKNVLAESIKDDEGTQGLTKRNIIILLGVFGRIKRQQLTH